ncbi:MAG: hypothetical protein L3J20_10375 [Flavobacteriaceae bacterium]|nr:hypothetical protein [Flavobacteriaceae bacterium]
MGFLAKYFFEGNEYTVVESSPAIEELIDSSGELIVVESKGGYIKLTLEVNSVKEAKKLSLWIEDSNLPKEGTIVFYKEETTQQYAIEFSNAYCHRCTGKYSFGTSYLMKMALTIHAQYIEVSKIDFNNLLNFKHV